MINIPEILAQFPFLDAKAGDPYDHEAAKASIIKNVTLPDFYTFDSPTPVYTVTVVADNDLVYVTVASSDNSPVGGTFGDIESAYDYVRNELSGDVIFAGDIEAVTGEEYLDGVLTVPSKTAPQLGGRMLISSTDSDDEWLAKANYIQFLQKTLRYEANPKDFVTAFNWVDSHPAFWSRHIADTNQWNTSNNSHVWVGVGRRKDTGSSYIMLEHGSAVESDRTRHYHDLRLDVYADTYELAFVELAALVHKFFDVDGRERENVEYVKSALEVTLDERMASLAADLASEGAPASETH